MVVQWERTVRGEGMYVVACLIRHTFSGGKEGEGGREGRREREGGREGGKEGERGKEIGRGRD